MQRGRFDVGGIAGALAASLVVFDDGLVVVQGSKAAMAGAAFGAIGGAVADGTAARSLSKKLAVIDGLGPAATAAQAAEAVKGAWLVLPSEVVSVKIAKSLLQSRKLTVKLSSKTLKLSFVARATPVAKVVDLLQPLVGDRLEVDPAAT